ncbi:MAG: hypothetical protein ACKOZM_00820 [Flavobacteriales bacterium]
MNRISKLFFLLSIACSALTAGAQKNNDVNPDPEVVGKRYSKHGIGAVLSSVNGKGLAYRYWPETFGIQVSFIPAASNSEQFYNAGLTGYARLKKYSVGELFLHAGVEYQYQTFEQWNYLSSSSYYDSYKVISNGINAGFGPGYHFELKPVSFDIFMGYGAYIRDESSTSEYATLNDRVLMTLSGGVAVFLNL